MIKVFESGDVHASNAEAIFGVGFSGVRRKVLSGRHDLSPAEAAELVQLNKLRTIAKSAGFAVAYDAEAQTVYVRILASGTEVTLPQVQAVLRKLHAAFAVYFEWQSKRLLEAIATGYTAESITGRTRYVTHDPSPPEVSNFAIQGGAAGIMNTNMPLLVKAIAARKIPARMIAQVHDSGVFDVSSRSAADDLMGLIPTIMSAPLIIRGRECVFPVDLEVSDRWH
jgi:DNA polymerase I-like protein with 3'-5' exonuclease and polymerase domains